MARGAKPLGSEGWVTKALNTDIITEMTLGEGWSNIPAKSIVVIAKDDIVISVNGLTQFELLAGDKYEETEDLISSLIILTDSAEFRYLAKF